MAAQAGDRVHDEQSAARVNQISHAGKRLKRAGAGLGVDDPEEPDARVEVQRSGDLQE